MNLEHLSDIHTARNAERIQNDLQRRAVCHERHIFLGQHARYDALVTVASRHFVADRDLAFLRYIHTHELAHARFHFVAVRSRKHLDVYDYTAFAVRNFERRVAHFARFVAEYCAEQTLFGRKIGFALGRDLTYENIARIDFRTHAHYTVLVEVFERLGADVRYIARYLFGTELGIPRFGLVLVYVNRREHVVLGNALAYKDSVLVVVTFPAHKADEYVFAERKLRLRSGVTVGKDVTLFHTIALAHYGALIYTSALVGADEFFEQVHLALAVVFFYDNAFGVHVFHNAAFARDDHYARVVRYLVLDARADYRRFGPEQRNSLTLHVGRHERAVRVVVLEERDERRCDRDHLSRRNVDIIYTIARNLAYKVAVTHHDARLDEPIVLVERLARLRYHVSVLLVGGQIIDYIGDAMIYLIDPAIRRFDVSALVDTGIARKRRYKTYVLTFGRLDRAHTRVVRIVNVTHLESDVLAVETAGSQCRKLALVRKLRYRVGLVHELRELRRAEKLFDRARNGTHVYERLRRKLGLALYLHALSHDAFQSRHADAELILQKLAHRTHSAVAQVIDVVARAEPVMQAHDVIDRSDYILYNDMLDYELIDVLSAETRELFAVAVRLVHKRFERGIVYHFGNAYRARVYVDVFFEIDVVVRDDVEFRAVLVIYPNFVDTRVLDLDGKSLVQYIRGSMRVLILGARVYNAVLVDDVARNAVAVNAVTQRELFVVFISADARQVVFAAVEEHTVNERLYAVERGRFAAAEFVVKLVKRAFLRKLILIVLVRIARASDFYHRLVVEYALERLVRAESAVGNCGQTAQKNGCEHLLLSVDAHPQNARRVLLELKPRAARRNVLRAVMGLSGLDVLFEIEVYAGRTNELADDYALRSVYDKRTRRRHTRQIAHIHLGTRVFARLAIAQAYFYVQRHRIRCVAVLAFLFGVVALGVAALAVTETVVLEVQFDTVGIVRDRRKIAQNFFDPVVDKIVV